MGDSVGEQLDAPPLPRRRHSIAVSKVTLCIAVRKITICITVSKVASTKIASLLRWYNEEDEDDEHAKIFKE